MSNEFIHNRGRGPEIVGTRITVYNLLPYFLDPEVTEEYIAKLYGLTIEQIAAARAAILNNAESVMSTHRKIEARIATGNPPEVADQLKRTHERFVKFKQWLERKAENGRRAGADDAGTGQHGGTLLPAFREWLSQQPSQSREST